MDRDYIIELFAAFGHVTVRRLFGGRGIYADGMMFALVSSLGVIYLKVDDETAETFRREGMEPFRRLRAGPAGRCGCRIGACRSVSMTIRTSSPPGRAMP